MLSPYSHYITPGKNVNIYFQRHKKGQELLLALSLLENFSIHDIVWVNR